MAHLWIRWQEDGDGEQGPGHTDWAIARLPEDARAFVLTDDPRQPVRIRGKGSNGSVVAELIRFGDRLNETWVLQSPARELIQVNGFPLVGGIRVLQDKEEILTRASGRIYFSTQRTPTIEPFPGREEATSCPRCKGTIAEGEPSVMCPACFTWHHEGTDRPCWSYTEKCALCDQLTRLDTGVSWTPENL